MKWHWICLQLTFEGPKRLAVASRRAALSGSAPLIATLSNYYVLLYTFELLYSKFIQDGVYQILSELAGFCRRHVKNILVFCFGSKCSDVTFSVLRVTFEICRISGQKSRIFTYI